MPNYGKDDHNPNSWGYDFPLITRLLAKCVEKHSKKKKVTVIMHDWGCFYGSLLMTARPDLVTRIVSLDIGGYQDYGFWHSVCFFSYQLFLAQCFLIGDPVAGYFIRAIFGKTIKHRPVGELRA